MSEPTEQQNYDRIQDVPTKLLATNFVCSLIMAKGNVGKWQSITELLIRELRGEPLGDGETSDQGRKP